ncbi:MAG: hypothetical protein O9346_03550 [Leptospiraceae bacterium]|jgi:hypothetical protein|nr:hypothetical protein [Leptospiraceae bacterium]MCZ8345470.1 hypothetical protein [Leptospiraceae bacterium]PJD99834.1 MAG: hypothetical protein CK427_15310 [Leptospira sp.]
MNLIEGIEKIRQFSTAASMAPALAFIESLSSHSENKTFLDEVGAAQKYPDVFLEVLYFLNFILRKRLLVNSSYEKCLEKYQTLNQISSKRRPVGEEGKIKETLTDFILRVEKLFEQNDITDEGVFKELSRFIEENNIGNLTENELKTVHLTSKATALLEPHFDKLREIFFGYEKLIDPLKRLINISDLILEESNRMVG